MHVHVCVRLASVARDAPVSAHEKHSKQNKHCMSAAFVESSSLTSLSLSLLLFVVRVRVYDVMYAPSICSEVSRCAGCLQPFVGRPEGGTRETPFTVAAEQSSWAAMPTAMLPLKRLNKQSCKIGSFPCRVIEPQTIEYEYVDKRSGRTVKGKRFHCILVGTEATEYVFAQIRGAPKPSSMLRRGST